MVDDRIAALERLAVKQNDTIGSLIDHVRALMATNAAMAVHLGDEIDRDVIREAALATIGSGPDNAEAAALVEALTRDPTDHRCGAGLALADVAVRLQ